MKKFLLKSVKYGPLYFSVFLFGLLFQPLSLDAQCTLCSDNTVNTVAGNGTGANTGDGGQASAASVEGPIDLVFDNAGNYYFSAGSVVRRVAPDGVITTFAGTGVAGFTPDGMPATATQFDSPTSLEIDALGRLIILDMGNSIIRRVELNNMVTTLAGMQGVNVFAGDGGLAVNGTFNGPFDIAIDPNGDIYVAENGSNRIRVFTPGGNINTFAGNGMFGTAGNGGPALNAQVQLPLTVEANATGVYFNTDDQIRVVPIGGGNINAFAGQFAGGFSGDGGPALNAEFNLFAGGLRFDCQGNLNVFDSGNSRVRRISVGSNIVSTIAGTTNGFSGDGGPATAAQFGDALGGNFGPNGNLFITDAINNRIRRVGTCPIFVDPVPTLSQWGLLILGLLILNLGLVLVYRMQFQSTQGSLPTTYIPFNQTSFGKYFVLAIFTLATGFILAITLFGYDLMTFDIPGSFITAGLVAYLLQILEHEK